MTDVRDCFVANLVIGVLHPEEERKYFLILSKSLEKINHGAIIVNGLPDGAMAGCVSGQ